MRAGMVPPLAALILCAGVAAALAGEGGRDGFGASPLAPAPLATAPLATAPAPDRTGAPADPVVTGSIAPSAARPVTIRPLREPPPLLRRTDDPFPEESVFAANGLDLRGSLEEALQRSSRIKAAQDEVGAAKANVYRQGLSFFLPSIVAQYDLTRSYNTGAVRPFEVETRGRTGRLRLVLPLWTSGQRLFDYRGGLATLDAARADESRARNEVAFETASAYLNYVFATRTTRLIEENVRRLNRLLAAVDARQAQGFASETDRAQVEGDLDALKEQLVATRITRAKAREAALSLVGAGVRGDLDLRRLAGPLANGEESLVAAALADNPNIMAERHRSDAARYRSLASVSALLPQVALTADYERDFDRSGAVRDRDSWNVMARLSVPVIDPVTVPEIARTKMLASAARHRADETTRLVALQIKTLWKDHVGLKRQLAFLQDRVKQRRRVAASFEEQYRNGLASLEVVLDRQQMLASAEIEQQRIELQHATAAFRLLIEAGLFDPSLVSG